MRNHLSKFWTWLGLPLVSLALTACASIGPASAPAPAWSDAQAAYVELVSYQAAQEAAIAVARLPGLSPRDVADIQAGEATATAAVTAQAEGLAGGGDIQGQAVAALTSAAINAAASLQRVVTAKHGSATTSSTQIAEAGGLAVLAEAPAVMAAIERVRGGWAPTGADIGNAIQDVQLLHEQLKGLAATASRGA